MSDPAGPDDAESALAALPDYQTIGLDSPHAHVLRVTLDRPSVGNALNTAMGREALDLWSRLTADPGPWRCLILTGAGDKVFCAGGDLKERNDMTRAAWQAQHELFERQYWALVDLPLPVLAAVNGHAYGGGLEFALCCDFIYLSDRARLALPEVTLGIMPGGGGTQNLPRAIGERRAKEMLLSGRPIDAATALSWGLVNAVYPPATLMDAAIDTAAAIAGNAPLSTRQIKKSVRYGGQMELRTAYRFEVEAYNHLVDTDDRREGVRAFNEKRPPRFKGR
ncbi:MAG: enoyl-CoA hydratase-related protein [Burkholderiaceae bacterium]